jgi:pSer/pThr/pTyr-binding forkhead associated (FHA) protein
MKHGALLSVTKGEARDLGRVLVFGVGTCVMIGRSPDVSRSTGMITQHSLIRLDDEDHIAVTRHLKTRAPTKDGARAVFASFDRQDDVGLGDDAVSSRHAMIFCDEAGLTLLDMGSTNGTFVNGERVISSDLVPGDLLRIGETRFSITPRRV